MATVIDISKVTRLEVIDEYGRSYVNLGAQPIELALQDDGRTLKIFCAGGKTNAQKT